LAALPISNSKTFSNSLEMQKARLRVVRSLDTDRSPPG